jgi:hypothetical protein
MPEPSDEEWLLARERGDDVSHVPAQTRARYAELEQLISALPGLSPGPAWKRRVLDGLDGPPSRMPQVSPLRRRRWAVAGALVAAAAVIVVILAIRGRRIEALRTDVVATAEIQRAGKPHRGTVASVGDTWVVQIDAVRPIELRVYGDAGELLASCPDGPDCTVTPDGQRRRYVLRLTLASRGDVRAVVFVGTGMPAAQGLESDLAAAQRIGLDARQVAVVPVQ